MSDPIRSQQPSPIRARVSALRRHSRGAATGLLLAGTALLGAAPAMAGAPAAAPVPVSRFATRGLADWQTKVFDGTTDYRLITDRTGTWLEARADDSGSGLYREMAPDLGRTPVLAWSWWVDAPVPVADVRTKEGDDFAARVYVVFSGGLAFWRTTTLVYVWGTTSAPAGPWANPFTDHARMITVSRGRPTASWTEVRRNVVEDYRQAFGHAPGPVSAVAIMTDTDQTGARCLARYRDLRFEPAGN